MRCVCRSAGRGREQPGQPQPRRAVQQPRDAVRAAGTGAAGRTEGVDPPGRSLGGLPGVGVHQVLRSSDHVRTHSSYGTHLTSVRPSTQFSTGVVQ